MLDDFPNIKIAFSIGVDHKIKLDKTLADKGINIYIYGHIDKLPYEMKFFHWKKIGLSINSENLYKLQTLEDTLKDNGHLNEKNMTLKIDIEDNEDN